MSEHDKTPTCPDCHKPMTYDNQMDYAFFCCDNCNLEIPHYQSAKVWRARKSYKECYQAGQQNPDPKQYAKREDLEKAFRDRRVLGEITFPEIENIIRTHGLPVHIEERIIKGERE